MDLQPDDEVLEIGPGIGFLTRILCERSGSVTAVELDRQSVDYLKQLKLANLSIKHGDILAYDINSGRFRDKEPAWDEQEKEQKLKIVGNLPYQITGLILGHLIGEIGKPAEHLSQVERIVLTVQKEVAHRMVAKAGSKNYSQVSLLIGYFCKAEIVCDLPAEFFFPPPRVDSAVVRLTPLAVPPIDCKNVKFLKRVIKAGFSQRRKMLRNALCSLGISLEKVNEVFKDLRLDPQSRAETLSLEQFSLLSDALETASK